MICRFTPPLLLLGNQQRLDKENKYWLFILQDTIASNHQMRPDHSIPHTIPYHTTEHNNLPWHCNILTQRQAKLAALQTKAEKQLPRVTVDSASDSPLYTIWTTSAPHAGKKQQEELSYREQIHECHPVEYFMPVLPVHRQRDETAGRTTGVGA
mmetsp:Transcript_47160/g.84412  ORF Transcript_47160/g.84412 Transcript_47160/m.84412 type:complete len:154 (-) Transcript_47160:20-481(-)